MARKGMEKDRYMSLYLVTALICIVITVIITALLIFGNLFSKEESGKVVSDISIPQSTLSEANSEVTSVDNNSGIIDLNGYKEISVQNDTLPNGDLILVTNKTDVIAPDKNIDELSRIYDKIPEKIYVLSTIELYLETSALDPFNQMMKGFYEATSNKSIMVNNAYSTLETLKDENLFTKFADLASGRSVRLVAYQSASGKMGEGVYLWIADNCHKYGYILRYPADKTEQTGADSSVSLFRYVGIPHAKYMKENNLSLEEYLELLKTYDYKNPLLYIDSESGEAYRIYYKAVGTGTSTTLNVPDDMSYLISGNNIDGFIVTVSEGKAVQ